MRSLGVDCRKSMYCSIHHQKADITIDNDNVPGSWRKLRHDDFANPLEDYNVVMRQK